MGGLLKLNIIKVYDKLIPDIVIRGRQRMESNVLTEGI